MLYCSVYIFSPSEWVYFQLNRKLYCCIYSQTLLTSSSPSGYGPISLLSLVSKILELLVFNVLFSIISGNKIFSNNQFGFCPGFSTECALLSVTQLCSSQILINLYIYTSFVLPHLSSSPYKSIYIYLLCATSFELLLISLAPSSLILSFTILFLIPCPT